MQSSLVPDLPLSGGYENIELAMDVFFRFLFAYPTSLQDAKKIFKVIINILTNHAYLPTTLIWDKGSTLVSHGIEEVACVPGITLKLPKTNYVQTIGLLERSEASIKRALKIETGE